MVPKSITTDERFLLELLFGAKFQPERFTDDHRVSGGVVFDTRDFAREHGISDDRWKTAIKSLLEKRFIYQVEGDGVDAYGITSDGLAALKRPSILDEPPRSPTAPPIDAQSVTLQIAEFFCWTCHGCVLDYRELLEVFMGGPKLAEVSLEEFEVERFGRPHRMQWKAEMERLAYALWPDNGFGYRGLVLPVLKQMRWDNGRGAFPYGDRTFTSAHDAAVEEIKVAAWRWTHGVERFGHKDLGVPLWMEGRTLQKLHAEMLANGVNAEWQDVGRLMAELDLERTALFATFNGDSGENNKGYPQSEAHGGPAPVAESTTDPIDKGPTFPPTEDGRSTEGQAMEGKATMAGQKPEPKKRSLTVTKAAESLKEVIFGLSLANAKARVSDAATRKKFQTNGKKGTRRRIDPVTFEVWLREQKEQSLDEADGISRRKSSRRKR